MENTIRLDKNGDPYTPPYAKDLFGNWIMNKDGSYVLATKEYKKTVMNQNIGEYIEKGWQVADVFSGIVTLWRFNDKIPNRLTFLRGFVNEDGQFYQTRITVGFNKILELAEQIKERMNENDVTESESKSI